MKVSEYLINNYYSKTNRLDIIPTEQQIKQAMLNHPDKIMVIRDSGIKGIAWFLKLTDETYNRLHELDITRIDVLQALSLENGDNLHFILVCGQGFKNIRVGIRRAKKLGAKTISWWNPSFTKLHRYICHQ